MRGRQDIQGDRWREVLRDALAAPSAESWAQVVRIGNLLSGRTGPEAPGDREHFRRSLADRLPAWPAELDRKVPARWPEAWKEVAERRVRETDTYGRYVVGVGTDFRLRRADGGQALSLRRRFVGGARTADGLRRMKLGDNGEPDLRGWMTLDLPWGPLAIEVALEVKEPGNGLDADQIKWRDAALRAGVVYCLAYTVEEAVLFFVERRRTLTARLKGVPT